MAFNLFSFLDWKIPKKMSVTSEKKFCDEHQSLFSFYGFLNRYSEVTDSFSLLKKAIVLQALLNKKQIEDEAELYSETELATADRLMIIHNRLPYFEFGGVNVYVPLFSPIFNRRYDTNVDALNHLPYLALKHDFSDEIIDPFETYSTDLFCSPFTHLVLVERDSTCSAFYHVELETVFIINDQGSLDHQIPLFDSDIKIRNYRAFFPRLSHLLDAYFNYDREEFIKRLYHDEFISAHLYQEILSQSDRYFDKRRRRMMRAFDGE